MVYAAREMMMRYLNRTIGMLLLLRSDNKLFVRILKRFRIQNASYLPVFNTYGSSLMIRVSEYIVNSMKFRMLLRMCLFVEILRRFRRFCATHNLRAILRLFQAL